MKNAAYVISIMISYFKLKGLETSTTKNTPLQKKRIDDDHDENGVNRFVAAILQCNRDNCNIFVDRQQNYKKNKLKVTKLTFENYKIFMEAILDANIKDVGLTEIKDAQLKKDFDRMVMVIKAYRNCMMYVVGNREHKWSKDDDKKMIAGTSQVPKTEKRILSK